MVILFILLLSLNINAQTPGLRIKPAEGVGTAILDPKGDGYSSETSIGFITDGVAKSEIPFASLVRSDSLADLSSGPDNSISGIIGFFSKFLIPFSFFKINICLSFLTSFGICNNAFLLQNPNMLSGGLCSISTINSKKLMT